MATERSGKQRSGSTCRTVTRLIPFAWCVLLVQFMLLAAFTPIARTNYRDLNSFNPSEAEMVRPPPFLSTFVIKDED